MFIIYSYFRVLAGEDGTRPSIASNRDGKDLTEAEDVKKMGKEYTEEQKKMQKRSSRPR